MAEAAIEDHALIGDRATAALVSRDGVIDFMCWPRFDGPTVFAALLDEARGGAFSIRPELADARTIQLYLPDTNVLLTRWLSQEGSAEVIDCLRPADGRDGGEPQLVRRVEATRGVVTFDLACRPRFDYARKAGAATPCPNGVLFRNDGDALRLVGSVPLEADGADARASFRLKKGEIAWFVLDGGDGDPLLGEAAAEALQDTVDWWRSWAARSTYRGRWRETVMRSALALKLMTSREHGSIVAAPTFGLPEEAGGVRNWDYRATWIRDASFTVYAFMRLGYREEAMDYVRWVHARIGSCAGELQIMYAIDGSGDLEERELDHLAGHRGSRPVRVGNAAAQQTQLDVYGELLDAVYLADKHVEAMSHDGWAAVTRVVEHVCERWRDADAGIWEMRGKPQEFLHSRLMSWVAIDRAVRLARKRSLPCPFVRWSETRDAIRADVFDNFWNAELGRFVQSSSSTRVDAALLMMPLVRFIGARDPRWLATLDAIAEELTDDSLVFRYRHDDALPGREGAFTACSFWYVECLARAGRLDEARLAFEKVLGYANHVGLYAEELALDGSHLGNFPQALTHLALISAAYFLDRELSGEPQTWRP